MFCACEIPSRGPYSGRSQGTWPSGLLQAPGRDSQPAMHVQPSSAAALIKTCVAPASVLPHACPCADTEFYLKS